MGIESLASNMIGVMASWLHTYIHTYNNARELFVWSHEVSTSFGRMAEWLMSVGQYFGMKFIKKGNLRRAIQKHEWMPRMLPTHSTLPPSAIEKVILSLSYEEMTRKIYVDAKLSRWLNLENFMFNKRFFFIIKKISRNVSFCIAIQPILVGGKKIKILALAEDQKNYHTSFFTCSH